MATRTRKGSGSDPDLKSVPAAEFSDNDVPPAGDSMVNLGDAAAAAVANISEGVDQEALDGTDYTKVKFVGISMDSLEENVPRLGEERTFIVKGRCIGSGTQLSKQDGHEKKYVQIDVSSVKYADDE